MRTFPLAEPVERVVPAATLCVWPAGGAREGKAQLERLETFAARDAGFWPAGPGRFLTVPLPGDPAVYDRALALAREALRDEKEAAGTRVLVLPAAARIRSDGSVLPVEETLLAELGAKPPPIDPARLQLTTHAALHLEGGFAIGFSGSLALAGGRQIPVASVRPQQPATPAFRNREVLSRELKWIPRPDVERDLVARLRDPLVRVEGPLGVGKTRAVWELLREAGEPVLWRNAAAAPLKSLERELATRGERPLRLVYDHLEQAPPDVWAEIEQLVGDAAKMRGLSLVFVSRPAVDWPAALAGLSPVRIGAMAGEPWDRLALQLFRGLSLPDPVAAELASGAAGNPFALEEALHFLVRDRKLRQVFGSFFFSGSEGTPSPIQPSRRFTAHVEAELLRLGSPLPLRLLTRAGTPVPADELASAVLALGGERPAASWELRPVAAGLLETADGPWGPGLDIASPAIRASISDTLPEATATVLRTTLGELLAARSSWPEELWASHKFLAGSESGARTLLAAAAGTTRLPREELFTALRHELASLHDRNGSQELEIELLWALLPLARRMGRLQELAAALERGFDLSREQPHKFLAIAALRADLAQKAGKFVEAESVLRQALAAARASDTRRKELLLVELGRVLARQGKGDEARDLFTRVLAVAERHDRKGLATNCRFHLGNLAFHEHRLEEALALHTRALDERREQRTSGVAASLTALGAVSLAHGNAPQSLAFFEEARDLLAAEQAEEEEAFALVGVGRALTRLGDVAGATPALRRALALRESRDDTLGEAIARLAVAENFLLLDQPDTALAEARKAHFVLSLQQVGETLADADQLLGRIQSRLRRHELAIAHLEEADRIHGELGKRAARLADGSYRIAAEVARGRAEGVREAYETLLARRDELPHAPALELREFHLFLAADWLESKGVTRRGGGSPLAHLEAAYGELMRQTAFLAREMRQRFLFEVPLHRAIAEAATRRSLALPSA